MARSGWIPVVLVALAACTSEPMRFSPSATDASVSTTTVSDGATTATWSTDTTSTTTTPAPALRVLFVGNSYTYVNDLPGWVKKLADASDAAQMTVDSVTAGGATLQDQISVHGAVDRIRKGGWTHVVLQGQSVEPLLAPTSFEAAAATLAAEAKLAGAVPVFYETWARRAGDAVYAESWSGGAPAAMQAGLRSEYQKVASVGGGKVARAGDAWERALAEQPAIGLFQADGSHPTGDGTYLVACVFLAALTGKSAVGIAVHPSDVSDAEAAALQAVADEIGP